MNLNRMDKSTDSKVGLSRPSSTLRPPPLFRTIGPSGLPAGLPPHRRLRSLFCRSRSVLPATTHTLKASETHTFTDIQTGNHALMCSLDCNDSHSEHIQSCTALNGLKSDSHLNRRAAFRSAGFTDALLSSCPQEQSNHRESELLSDLCPSAITSGRNRGRQARLVTPLQTSEHPAIKQKQQQKKKKRSHRVDCAGRQKYVVPSLTEKEEDARLCEWLQSLGIADSRVKASVTTNDQQRLFVSRCGGATSHGEPDAVANHRRDRRPHFLPPIYQSDSLLHVPLLLPENSPPPSPYTHPDAPLHSLPVPLLQPLLLRRK